MSSSFGNCRGGFHDGAFNGVVGRMLRNSAEVVVAIPELDQNFQLVVSGKNERGAQWEEFDYGVKKSDAVVAIYANLNGLPGYLYNELREHCRLIHYEKVAYPSCIGNTHVFLIDRIFTGTTIESVDENTLCEHYEESALEFAANIMELPTP